MARWGDRHNVDNWRSALALESISREEIVSSDALKTSAVIVQETPENFVAALPQTIEEKDSIALLNHKAYLQSVSYTHLTLPTKA